MTDDLHLSDLVSVRADLRDLRERLKGLRDELNADRASTDQLGIEDVLALAPKNDAGYVRPSDLEKAEWFAEIFEAEDALEVHPRGLYNTILDKGYERRNGEP